MSDSRENGKITDGHYDKSLAVKCINGTFVGRKEEKYLSGTCVGRRRWM